MTTSKTHKRARWGAAMASSLALVVSTLAVSSTDQTPSPIPSAADVLLVGDPQINGEGLSDREAIMAMGRSDKIGPLALGATIQAGALQTSRLETVTEDGIEVLRRTVSVTRPGSEDVMMRASIDMDPTTLLPLVARTEQAGQENVVEYDWDNFVVRTIGAAESEITLDMPMFEVGTHDVWMAALPLKEGFVARLPAVFAVTGTKYWAVPRVVGSEAIDLGDGRPLQSWVVELDWWGMGADNTAENHSLGGGANDTAGPGGKYWVLKDPPAGVPPVVRVRTEVDAETDSVIQIQDMN